MPDTKIDIAELRGAGSFSVNDLDPTDDHGPIYLQCPNGLLVNFSCDATPGLDARRVAWVAETLNALPSLLTQLEQSQREVERVTTGWSREAAAYESCQDCLESSQARVAELTAEVERKDAVIQAMEQVTVGPLSYTAMRAERDASQALVARLRLAASMTAFAWLIEAPGQRYLGAREIGHHPHFYWVAEPEKALRFISKDQADKTMMAVRQMDPSLFGFEVTLGNAWPREHGWLARQALQEGA